DLEVVALSRHYPKRGLTTGSLPHRVHFFFTVGLCRAPTHDRMPALAQLRGRHHNDDLARISSLGHGRGSERACSPHVPHRPRARPCPHPEVTDTASPTT